MTGFPFPYVLVVSDGKTIRSLLPAQLGRAAPMIDAALAEVLLQATVAAPAPPAPPAPPAKAQPKSDDLMTQGEIARAQGYSGDCCTTCQNFTMKQAGHCLVCASCGTTTGCS